MHSTDVAAVVVSSGDVKIEVVVVVDNVLIFVRIGAVVIVVMVLLALRIDTHVVLVMLLIHLRFLSSINFVFSLCINWVDNFGILWQVETFEKNDKNNNIKKYISKIL